MRPREPRRKVLIKARLKSDSGWHDACIVDLSKRGACLHSTSSPPRGSYVEIRRGLHVIVARVVWRRSERFGVLTQDELPVESIANDRTPVAGQGRGNQAIVERRKLPRSWAERADANRRAGQRLQYVLAICAGMAAATIAGSEVREALAEPLHEARAVLSGR